MTYPGVEVLLNPAGKAALGVRFVTDVPADLATVVPIVQLVQFGGGSNADAWRLREPNISVDAFAVDLTSALALGELVETWLRTRVVRSTFSGTTVTAVRTITGFSRRPWDDVAVSRVGASYQLFLNT